jgi:hypothetical protein
MKKDLLQMNLDTLKGYMSQVRGRGIVKRNTGREKTGANGGRDRDV